MKTFKLVLMVLVSLTFIFTGCKSEYSEVGLSEAAVVNKSAWGRGEGGGIMDTSFLAGTHEVGGSRENSTTTIIPTSPRTINLATFSIMMEKMKRQVLTFDLRLTYMLNPNLIWNTYKNFKSYDQEINKAFKDASQQVLNKIDMGLKMDDGLGNKDVKNEFADRLLIADKILNETKDIFNNRFPEYKDNFYFITTSINNVEFPKKVLETFEKAVAQRYKTYVMEIESKIKAKKNLLKKMDSESDMEAFAIEGGIVSDAVIEYISLDLVSEMVQNPEIDLVIVIEMDEEGNLIWFTNKDKELKELAKKKTSK